LQPILSPLSVNPVPSHPIYPISEYEMGSHLNPMFIVSVFLAQELSHCFVWVLRSSVTAPILSI
jgi:hypothetical protein